MTEVEKAIDLAMQEFKKENGEDAHLEEGDEFVTVFNNCALIISLEDGEYGIRFIGGKPFKVDMDLRIYKDVK